MTYGDATVLDSLSLTVEAGELMVVIGASGCGKSTLLRVIAGLDAPGGGRLSIDGRDMTGVEPAARGVAMIFQNYALYPHLTVAQNIGFPLSIARVRRSEIAARVAAVADMLGLGDLLGRRPHQLSGGQRQRVAIGRAVVREPGLLLLDEPLSNLDAALRVRMRHELARLHQRLGCTMVYVTHDQLEAMTLANRIVVMAAGRIEQVGTPQRLYDAPATIEVARAIGSPAMNLLAVRIVAADEAGTTVALTDGASCRVAARVAAEAVGGPATLGVRPEHLRLDAAGPLAGAIELFERLGPLSFVHLGEAGAADTLVAQLPGDAPATLGDRVAFAIVPGTAHLFDERGRAWSRPAATP